MAYTEYLVWCPERGQERCHARRVPSPSPRSAATDWARMDDAESADYLIVNGTQTEVLVAEDRDNSPVQRFAVRGEAEPVYYARAIPPGGRE